MAMAFPTPDHSKSLIRNLDVRWRMISFFCAMLLVAFLRDWRLLFPAMVYAILWLALSWRDYHWYLPRLAWVILGLGIFIVPGCFLIPGETLWSIGWIHATREGIQTSVGILFRGITISALALTMIGSASFYDLAGGARQLGLGRSLASIFWLGFEQIEVIQQEFKRMRVALKARGQGTSSKSVSWRGFARLCANLLVRSLDKSERVHLALLSRGFQGDFPLSTPLSPSWRGPALFFSTCSVPLGLLILDRLWAP